MELQVRDHVPTIATVLTLVSLSLVFGAVLGVIPASAFPRASGATLDAIPHVNAAISALAIVTILGGVRFIRRGDVRSHRVAMLVSVVLFVAFLVLYLYKVVLQGPATFPGPNAVYQFLYLPTLAVHIVLAVICIPLLYYVLLLALTRPVADLARSNHARVGRIAASLWVTSFALGNVVYVLLYVIY
ncbi:MAG: DUF420 domain-containing protein [Halobacteriota archaeon]